MRPHSTVTVHLDVPDGWPPDEQDRPNVYTEAQAARRVGVSRRTIREWRTRGWLTPVPGSLAVCGQHLYDGPALARAEHKARRGRARRRRSLP